LKIKYCVGWVAGAGIGGVVRVEDTRTGEVFGARGRGTGKGEVA
jgi:hypothetical protein